MKSLNRLIFLAALASLVTAQAAIVPAPDDQEEPSIAANGNGYFAVWADKRSYSSTEYDIYGARVSGTGEVLDPTGIRICTDPGRQTSPRVAFDGERYLVVWEDDRESTSAYLLYQIYGARVTTRGQVLDPNGFKITTNRVSRLGPAVASDGHGFFVAWGDWHRTDTAIEDVYGSPVSSDGVVANPDGIPLVLGPGWQGQPRIAFANGEYLMTYRHSWTTGPDIWGIRVSTAGQPLSSAFRVSNSGHEAGGRYGLASNVRDCFVVWGDSRGSPSGFGYPKIYGTLVRSNGVVASPDGIPIATNALYQDRPRIASDGNGFLVVWQESNDAHEEFTDVYAAKLTGDGTVGAPARIEVNRAPGVQQHPDVAFSGGNYLVAWQDGRSSPNNSYPLGAFDVYGTLVSGQGAVSNADGILFSSFQPNEPLPLVYIAATVPETLEPSPETRVAPGEFTITRVGSTNEPLILFLEFTGTATSGQDYEQASQFLTLPAGERKLTVLVAPRDDSAVEDDETVIATLTDPPIGSLLNYGIDPLRNRATVVIHDNDFPGDLPVVSISGLSTVLEFCPPNADCAGISFSLRRTGPGLDRPLTVFLRYRGTASSGVDYRALPAQVTFEAGRDFASVSSVPIDDTLYEGDETIVAEIIAGLDYRTDPNRWQATTVIKDNDPPAPPWVSLELVDPVAMETPGFQNFAKWAEFRVLRTGPATEELVVFLNTRQGSARLGEDYWLERVNDGSTVRFLPGERSLNVRLYPIDDDFYEGDETVFFHLIAPPSGSDPYQIDFAHSSVAMVIHDNDPVTTRLEITAPRNEQHFPAGDVIELRAQIIGPGSSNVLWSVEFFDGDRHIGTTRPGGAIWWEDAIGGQHVINARAYNPAGIPGQDTLVARPVTIFVGPGPALPVVSIVATGWRTAEPCPVCLVAPGVFTVSRTGPTNEALTVSLEYDGTAITGQDYDELPHLIMIPAGKKSTEFLVLPIDDQLVEGPEIVRANIALPELATRGYIASLYANAAMVVIGDDEAGAPELRLDIVEPIDGAQFALGTAIQISALGVWTQGEVDRPVEFFAGDRFIGQSDPPRLLRPTIPGLPSVHMIFWTNPPPGRHALTARFAPIPNLSVTSPPVNITVGPTTLPVVRLETLPLQNAQAREFCPPNLECAYPSFVVRRNGPTNADLRVYLSYSGTATAGADYPSLPDSLVIPAGDAAAFLILVPKDDTLVEGPETVIARFTPVPGPGYIPDPDHTSATITIIDNERPLDTVVSIGTDDEVASETSILTVIDPARFRISRAGDLSRDELVFFSVHGSATEGTDYPELSSPIRIPAGERSVTFAVTARFDQLAEGMETVFIRLEPSPLMGPMPTYDIDPAGRDAVALILDNGSFPTPGLEIVWPEEGDNFTPPTSIEIVAAAYHPTRDVSRVDFYAGAAKIGESIVVFDKPTSGGLIVHRFTWNNPPGGVHLLTARGFVENEDPPLESRPVRITIGPVPPIPLVSIAATQRIAEESSAPFRRMNLIGEFTISRTEPTNNSQSLFVHYSGMATPGVDYPALPRLVTIPAGASSTVIRVEAINDHLTEGIETLVATLAHCGPGIDPPTGILCIDGFAIDPARQNATVFIRDDGLTEASLVITKPSDGASFPPGQTILIEATAVDLEGYINRVEFWDGEQRIGVSEIVFIRPPDPGTPIYHSFEWQGASQGTHVLTTRASRADGTSLQSQPVRITVGSERPLVRIEAVSPVTQEVCAPEEPPSCADFGVFRISRTGPTTWSLPVFVQYSGTATPGADYRELPFLVTIPEGSASTTIQVSPVKDSVPEGIENVVAKISNCPPPGVLMPCIDFGIDPAHQSATVFIRDDGITRASLVITKPKDSDRFNVGQPILIETTAIDLDGYISRVEFWDGEQRIGVSEMVFIRPPDPGTPIHHSFEWQTAPPGPHVLTARAANANGTILASPPIRIIVEPTDNQLPRIALTRPTAGAQFPPESAIEIVVETRDPDGFVHKVEFYADGRKIGERNVVFIRPPDPGQSQTFTFVWNHPTPGPHRLTARATDDDRATATSAPVEINVTIPDQLPIVTVVARDSFAVEPASNADPNTATFRIRRFGPTNGELLVKYSLRGTAQNGVDYETLSGLAVIAAGQLSATVTVRPLADNLAERIETVILRLEDPPGEQPPTYRVGFRRNAVALISDDLPGHASAGGHFTSLHDGLLHLCFPGQSGQNFRLEASSDLCNWETVFDSPAIDGALDFVEDETETFPHRFYRLAPEPVTLADE